MKRTLVTLGVVGLGLISLTAPAMAASDRVVVCHWDGSALTPLEFSVNGTGGHEQHTEDIIPPTPKIPAGKNWTNAGKALYVANCAPLPPGEVIDPVDPPVVVNPPVTPPAVTPPAEEPPAVVNQPVVEAPAVVNQPVVQPPAVVNQPVVQPPAPAAVEPATVPVQPAPAQPAPARQVAAQAPAAQQAPAAPAAKAVVGTNEGYNAQTAVGSNDGDAGWLAGVGALAAAGAAVAVRRRSRFLRTAG
ncbi:MAG: hypothetical protein HOQ06_05620 [Pseudarthrobacter sp.]|nr:hypothetical protein [Pseudarthrobacter sp.]